MRLIDLSGLGGRTDNITIQTQICLQQIDRYRWYIITGETMLTTSYEKQNEVNNREVFLSKVPVGHLNKLEKSEVLSLNNMIPQ